jgi:hypothetical protein
MKHLIVIALLAAAVTAVVASPSSAAAGATLRFTSLQTSFALSPQGPPTVGSRLIFTNAMYNRAAQFGKAAGARVGTSEGVCTIVSASKAQCTITAHLPNGELVVGGAMSVSKREIAHTVYAITGGAGAYAGARGSVSAHDLSKTRTAIDINLVG